MRTIELDTGNPYPFNNYVSVQEKRRERILIGILLIGVISYLLYETYRSQNETHEDQYFI